MKHSTWDMCFPTCTLVSSGLSLLKRFDHSLGDCSQLSGKVVGSECVGVGGADLGWEDVSEVWDGRKS
jgi:hypothetical protein